MLPAGLYTYDSTYQLIKAQGRQQVGGVGTNNKERLKSLPRDNELYLPYHAPKDVQALETYIEQYTYDNGGNMLQLSHTAASGSFTRDYIVANRTNRSVISTLGAGITPDNVDTYFDKNGNQLSLTSSQALTWNEHNNIQATILVKRDNNKNDAEYYVYDSSGARVRKVNQTYGTDQTTTTLVETIYLGGVEIHRTSSGSGESTNVTEEYHTLDTGVGNYLYWVVGTPPAGVSSPCTYYTFTDHLGSCTLDVDTNGKVVTVEEYTPYAMSCLSLGLGAALQLKTKRYGGKEKDATGLYYYGARYLSPTSCRWMSADPIGPVDGLNIYLFLNGNPVGSVDVNGNMKRKITKSKREKLRIMLQKVRQLKKDKFKENKKLNPKFSVKEAAADFKEVFEESQANDQEEIKNVLKHNIAWYSEPNVAAADFGKLLNLKVPGPGDKDFAQLNNSNNEEQTAKTVNAQGGVLAGIHAKLHKENIVHFINIAVSSNAGQQTKLSNEAENLHIPILHGKYNDILNLSGTQVSSTVDNKGGAAPTENGPGYHAEVKALGLLKVTAETFGYKIDSVRLVITAASCSTKGGCAEFIEAYKKEFANYEVIKTGEYAGKKSPREIKFWN